MTCGTVAEEDPQLVSEQQFNEQPGGRITAQGQTVAHDQTHQRTFGQPAGSGPVDGQQTLSHQHATKTAKEAMKQYLTPLNIPESEIAAGVSVWEIAYRRKFVQGRGLINVATVCFFLALRRRTEQVQGQPQPRYPVMLIDFAEIANVDVFSLGRMYTDLIRCLYLDTSTQRYGPEVIDLLAHGPEVLVDRFVDALEFPPQAVRRIKDDAMRIVKRMKRDWMNIGRRPAGVCGAAVILAARMNNHRRTTREVVLTAKVTEITLNKRLEEFGDVRSSQLSVTDFRNIQILNAIESADPPAYARAHNPPKPKKRKRGRPRKNGAPETAAEIEGEDAETVVRDGEPATKRARLDAEGFAIPDLPQRPSGGEAGPRTEGISGPTRGPGRPPGARNWRAPPITPAEQAIEDEIQRDIDQTLQENPELDPTPVTRDPVDEGQKLPRSILARLNQVKAASHQKGNTNTISLDPDIGTDEFEDDEEVAICLLTEEERRMKEIVWVTANADWLRQEHAKRIKRQLKEKELIDKGIDPSTLDKSKKSTRRKDGRLRAGPAGDIKYLQNQEAKKKRQGTGDEGEAEADGAEDVETPGADDRERNRTRSPSEIPFPAMYSAAASVHKFINHRDNSFASRRLNKAAVDEVYTFRRDSSSTPSDSRSPTQARLSGGSTDHAQVIFGALGSKESGLMRSKSSWSAERREKNKREAKQREGSGESGIAGPSGRAGLGQSASTSPETESDRERSGSTVSEERAQGPDAIMQAQPIQRSMTTSQQHTPISAQLDDGSVEEVVGSNPASRSHSDTPAPGDGLISLRDDAALHDDDEDDEDDDEGDELDDDEDNDAAAEPDLEDVFAGRAPSRRL